jgi:hypothetical protein
MQQNWYKNNPGIPLIYILKSRVKGDWRWGRV